MLECNVVVTRLSNANVTTLKSCFYLVSHFIRCLNTSLLSGIIVYVLSLVFVFFVLTQHKSVTDSIKELLSRKEMISSLSFVDDIPVTKRKWNVNTYKGNMGNMVYKKREPIK